MSRVKANWDQFPTNSFIKNLQTPMAYRTDNPDCFRHKSPAIRHAAKAVGAFRDEFPENSTFVPVPPSKSKDDPDYDSRLTAVLRGVEPPLDVRELVVLKSSGNSKQKGLSPNDRLAHYEIDENEVRPTPESIVIFDDVLTTGSHFKALQTLLRGRFADAPIYGLFLARAVRPTGEALNPT